MTYLDFQNSVLSGFSDRYADFAEVSLTNVKKNNGKELCALVVHEPECELSPTIYLNGYYDLLQSGHSYDDIFEQIVDTYENNRQPTGHIADNFSDFEWVKKHIVMRLINKEKNKDFLADVPHVPFLDLAICFGVRIEFDSGQSGTAVIHNNHAKTWGTDAMELYSHAQKNAAELLPPVIHKIEDLLSDLMITSPFCIQGDELHMYVLTNQDRTHGAAVICYNGAVKKLAEELSSDLIIIPSSIHDVIAIPSASDIEIADLNKTVEIVNSQCVAETDVLSDHAYFYSRETDRITY